MLSRLFRRLGSSAPVPTLLHLTHAKAGSTWITVMLHELFGKAVAPRGRKVAEASGGDLAQHVFEAGRVYPSMFMTREEVLAHPELNGSKRFIVIRDLRDTLTALYFSLKLSRSESDERDFAGSDPLQQDDEEAGLLHVLESRMPRIAAIQSSWLKQGEIVLQYEALVQNPSTLLEEALLRRLALPISSKALDRAIRTAPSERGRRTGGVDWRKHFTPNLRERFAERFGQVLIDSGYEKDRAWVHEPSSTPSAAGL